MKRSLAKFTTIVACILLAVGPLFASDDRVAGRAPVPTSALKAELAVECYGGAFHVDPATGNDAADGLTPATAWKTWNGFPSNACAGSSLLLKRGCKFALPLPIVGGSAGAPVVYGAYGNGPKPVLENKTIDLSEPASWTEESKGTWHSPSMPEVANVLMGGASGNMRYTKTELRNHGEWFQDATGRGSLFIRSTQNPAIEWKSIEVIPAGNGIVLYGAPHSHIRFENLWLRKIGTHGIWMPNGASDVTIRNCDLNLIGGAIFRQDVFSRSYGDRFVERRVRFGNAIETWGNVADVLIEGCRITDVFDGGITLQGFNDTTARNIVVRNNVIWNCGYDSIDIAHGLAPINVIIEHNTCWNAGEGWALQGESRPRYSLHIPDQIGYHLNFEIFDEPWDEQTAVTVRNNIFANAPAGRCFNFAPQPPLAADFQRFKIDRNCCFQANPADTLVQFGSRGFAPKRFGAAQFDEYRKFSGWDAGSIVADPLFIDAASADFRLQPNSSCTGMGAQGAVFQAETAAGRITYCNPSGETRTP